MYAEDGGCEVRIELCGEDGAGRIEMDMCLYSGDIVCGDILVRVVCVLRMVLGGVGRTHHLSPTCSSCSQSHMLRNVFTVVVRQRGLRHRGADQQLD